MPRILMFIGGVALGLLATSQLQANPPGKSCSCDVPTYFTPYFGPYYVPPSTPYFVPPQGSNFVFVPPSTPYYIPPREPYYTPPCPSAFGMPCTSGCSSEKVNPRGSGY
jgi:hypothetical protein